MAYTWPLARYLRTAITGAGDARHFVWMLWHTRQAVLGNDGLFYTHLLYYPQGTSLLVNALGPLAGLLALPLWAFGPEAAYNLTLLVGFALTGYCMYLLAREVGLSHGISLLAGIVYLSAPIHVAGIMGHLQKAFLGFLPLVLLGLHRLLDPRRSRWWAAGTALLLLLALLHTAEQLVYAGLAIAFLLAVAWLEAERPQRREIALRGALLAAATLILTGPLLLALYRASASPQIVANNNLEAMQHRPDLLEFLLPGQFARFLGPRLAGIVSPLTQAPLETAVFVGWTALGLSLLAILGRQRPARRWLLLALFSAVVALGPALKVAGQDHFTEYGLPVALPFALLMALPGLDFWRTPGRFMFVGFVGIAVAAGYGLDWLLSRSSGRWRPLLIAAVAALVIAETLPPSWPQEVLPATPAFYERLARDGQQYGVLDLPIRPYQAVGYDSWHVAFSSYYQIYQMAHGKGIAAGYVDRPYRVHPIFGQFISDATSHLPYRTDLTVEGAPAQRYANVRYELARQGYRYVVWHKPRSGLGAYTVDSWGQEAAEMFLDVVFDGWLPLVDDDLVRVYAVGPSPAVDQLTMTIAPRESTWQSWLEAETGKAWAVSPATYYVAAPRLTMTYLEVTPADVRDPLSGAYLQAGTLTLSSAGGMSASAPLTVGQTTSLPLLLSPGSGVITLTARPADDSFPPEALLDFSLGTMNLRTGDHSFPPPDIFVGGRPQEGAAVPVLAVQGSGWYGPDAPGWRWARSPAELLLHSDARRVVRLRLSMGGLHDPGAYDGRGDRGLMRVAANGAFLCLLPVEIGQMAVIDVPLERGWNSVALALASGNFVPARFQPGSGDARELSFAVHQIDVEFLGGEQP